MTWAVLCDFDHTVTIEDATDRLLEAHALPEWRQVETLWEQGFIGSRDCMQQQVALLRATRGQVDAVADGVEIDPHFREFSALCEKKHLPMVIVSDGLDYVIRHILNRGGMHHVSVIASHIEYSGGNRWELTAPFSNNGCTSQASTCKCTIAKQVRLRTGASKILYIGDGRSDYCVSLQEADMILAKSALLTYCQQQQLPHKPFETFAQASKILSQLIQQHDRTLPPVETEVAYA